MRNSSFDRCFSCWHTFRYNGLPSSPKRTCVLNNYNILMKKMKELECIFKFQLARVNSSLMEITSAHIFEILSLIIITPYNVLAADYSTSTNVVVIRLCCLSPAYLSKPSLICDFCPSDQGFAYSFLQIPPHDGYPCCSAIHFPLPGHVQDFHLRERAHGAQTKRAPPGAHKKPRHDYHWSLSGFLPIIM